jgi:hypothetical protein
MISTVLFGTVFWQYRPIQWGHERQITSSSGDSRLVDVAADPSSNMDSGATWNSETQISDYEPLLFPEFPAIGSNGTHVHLVWNNQGIQYSRSSDSGASWDGAVTITNTTRWYIAPRISVAGPLIQVVTSAISEGDPTHRPTSDIDYVSSLDDGISWSQPVSLTAHKPQALSLAPAIWSDGAASFIAWEDNRNGRYSVFFLSSPNFALLHAFEWQLLLPVGIVFAVTTTVYIGLELKTARETKRVTARRHVRRRTRKREHSIHSLRRGV